MESATYFYAEYMLDCTIIMAYIDLTHREYLKAMDRFKKSVIRGNNHAVIFGKTNNLDNMGYLGWLIKEKALPYHNDRVANHINELNSQLPIEELM